MRSRSSRGRERREGSRSGLVGAVGMVAGFEASDGGSWVSVEGCV
jgi:hypothetical protein